MWDDAEGATVVAALRDFQIGIVTRREPDALLRDEIDERVVRRGRRRAHGLEDALVILRSRDRQYVGKSRQYVFGLGAHASGHHHLAVFAQGGADRLQRLGLGAIEKAASVDDDHIGAGVAAREFIALRAQPRDDPLAVDQSLGTTERHEGNARRGGDGGFSQVIVGIFAHGRGLPRRGAIGNRAAG